MGYIKFLLLLCAGYFLQAMGAEKAYQSVEQAKHAIAKREADLAKRKKIHFTKHAIDRMEERGISRGEVEKAIEYGTKTVNNREKSVSFLRKDLIVVMDLEEKTVITVYQTLHPSSFLSTKEKAILQKKKKGKKRHWTHGLSKETKSLIKSTNE